MTLTETDSIGGATRTTQTPSYTGSDHRTAQTPQFLRGPVTRTISGAGPSSIVTFEYDGGALTHGNVTRETHGDSASSPEIITYQYDSYAANSLCVNTTPGNHGNITKATNAAGNTTVFCYDANYDRLVKRIDAANTSGQTPDDSRTFIYTYDTMLALMSSAAMTDRVQSVTDFDHSITTSYLWDALGRNVRQNQAGVSGVQTAYNDAARTITIRRDLTSNLDGLLTEISYFDELSRLWKTQDAAGNIVESLQLMPLNGSARYELVSNPASSIGATTGWTRTKRDTLGRVVEVKYFTGATQPTPWGTTDPATTGTATTGLAANCATAQQRNSDGRGRCIWRFAKDLQRRLWTHLHGPGVSDQRHHHLWL